MMLALARMAAAYRHRNIEGRLYRAFCLRGWPLAAAKWIPVMITVLAWCSLLCADIFSGRCRRISKIGDRVLGTWASYIWRAADFRLVYLRAHPDGLGLTVYLAGGRIGAPISALMSQASLSAVPSWRPQISPKKTWAGLFGGMALAVAFLAILSRWFWRLSTRAVAFGLAIVLAVIAQIGDLFKSYFKRRAGVKDSGQLIPGHGGVLDRIDGLIFAAMFFAMFEMPARMQVGGSSGDRNERRASHRRKIKTAHRAAAAWPFSVRPVRSAARRSISFRARLKNTKSSRSPPMAMSKNWWSRPSC